MLLAGVVYERGIDGHLRPRQVVECPPWATGQYRVDPLVLDRVRVVKVAVVVDSRGWSTKAADRVGECRLLADVGMTLLEPLNERENVARPLGVHRAEAGGHAPY